jgi:hypothetical protein
MGTKSKFKVLKWLIVLPILGIIFFVGLIAADIGGWGHRNMPAVYQQQAFFEKGGEAYIQQGDRHMQGSGHSPRSFQASFHDNRFHPGKMDRRHEGFRFIPFLAAAGLFTLGWFIRKNAGGSTWKKWTGAFLMLLALLPNIPIILISLAIYWLYKQWKKSRTKEEWAIEPSLSPVYGASRHAVILDEWEKHILKEEK